MASPLPSQCQALRLWSPRTMPTCAAAYPRRLASTTADSSRNSKRPSKGQCLSKNAERGLLYDGLLWFYYGFIMVWLWFDYGLIMVYCCYAHLELVRFLKYFWGMQRMLVNEVFHQLAAMALRLGIDSKLQFEVHLGTWLNTMDTYMGHHEKKRWGSSNFRWFAGSRWVEKNFRWRKSSRDMVNCLLLLYTCQFLTENRSLASWRESFWWAMWTSRRCGAILKSRKRPIFGKMMMDSVGDRDVRQRSLEQESIARVSHLFFKLSNLVWDVSWGRQCRSFP